MFLTGVFQKAIDASPALPPRLTDPRTGARLVLLRAADFDWVRNTLGDEPDAPRLTDPRNQQAYALLPEDRYERFKAFFEDDPISPAERQALFRAWGKRAGWDDPVWDADEDPHTPTET